MDAHPQYHIADHHPVRPAQLPQARELPESLLDPRLDRSDAQALGETECIPLVVFRPTARPISDTRYHDLLDVGPSTS